ncbi:outer membrane beta-barrel protein [Marinobacter sediminum]|uniref:outer membrane beta-barrel protein n=1 Tax=Marinobacter sediminum TaxID=256323 RepID=UPI00202E0893|nr:outer membrane beta-barrel protein [Marinobacter sediminum]MCM0611818.1 outer membrane beta-barrel protein [Marinobacter sediminum]
MASFAQLGIQAGQDARFTDNARKSASNETSDLESRTYLTASYITDPGRCAATFTGTLGYSDWLDNSFDSEAYASMDLASQCEVATGLYWHLDNNLREVTQDSTKSNTPDNRTRKNVFSTGPRYLWRLTDLDTVTFETKYQNTDFSEPEETDSKRYIGSVDWTHLFSQTFNGGLSVSYSSTELDSGDEIDVQTMRATFSQLWSTTILSGAFGISEIESRFDSNLGSNSKSDGWVGELNLIREVTPTTDWYLKGARELTDRTSSFDIRFGEFEFNLREAITVEVSTLSTGINKQFSDQGNLTVDLFANRSDYLESDQLEESVGLNLGYSRPVSEKMSGSTAFRYQYSKFEQDKVDDEAARIQFGLTYQASRDFDIATSFGHEWKESDVASREYDENWVLIGLKYRFR